MEYNITTVSAWTRLGMRKSFGAIMIELAKRYPDFIVLTADVASSGGLDEFDKAYPNRFFNVGIAEQNMTGIAAGLAKEGNNVFIASFAPFVSMRAYEAVRTLIGYMHLNVKIVALASGLSLGVQGNTHYGMEDIAIMRTIPGMTVLSPADCYEEAQCLEYLLGYDGPAYLRLTGIDGSPAVYRENFTLIPGEPILLREGDDVLIFSSGSVVSECVRAARALKRDDISCAVVNVPFIKPLNCETIWELCRGKKLVVSVEEHFTAGGLGGLIAEVLCSSIDMPHLLRIGVDDVFPHADGYQQLLEQCGLNGACISNRIKEALE